MDSQVLPWQQERRAVQSAGHCRGSGSGTIGSSEPPQPESKPTPHVITRDRTRSFIFMFVPSFVRPTAARAVDGIMLPSARRVKR